MSGRKEPLDESKTTAFTVVIARYGSFAKKNPTAPGNALRVIDATRYVGNFRKSIANIYYKNRIGIWGWSYGGYTTIMSMSEGTPVFKAGIAVAAPTDWKYYDTIYTERYMRTPKENASGYNASSAFSRANKLNGDLLLIHGMADDNVHYQNVAEYAEHLVQLDKQFDMQVYTNRNHGIYGGNTRNHLYRKMTNYFLNNL